MAKVFMHVRQRVPASARSADLRDGTGAPGDGEECWRRLQGGPIPAHARAAAGVGLSHAAQVWDTDRRIKEVGCPRGIRHRVSYDRVATAISPESLGQDRR